MSLSPSAVQELCWWPKLSGLSGWGAVMGEQSTGGHWNFVETSHHITYLEKLAAYFALLSFSECLAHQHVQLLMDHTTVVSVLTTRVQLRRDLGR